MPLRFTTCLFFTTFLLATQLPLAAQSPAKRALTHADYDRWQSVTREKISDDGRWISYQIDPQQGDGRLEIAGSTGSQRYVVPRGYGAQFTADSRFLVARLKAPYADTRRAKLKRKKPDELPKDSLLALNLATGEQTKLPNVKSVVLGKEGGLWLAVLQEANQPKLLAEVRVTPKKDSLPPGAPAAGAPAITTSAKPKTPAKKPKGDDLTLLNLADGTRQSFRYVTNVVMSDNGRLVFFSRDTRQDSLKTGVDAPGVATPGVFTFDTQSRLVSLVDTASRIKQYKGLAVSKQGDQLAWLASADSTGADRRVFALYYKNLVTTGVPRSDVSAGGNVVKRDRRKRSATTLPISATAVRVLLDTAATTGAPATGAPATTLPAAGVPAGWAVNEYTTPRFSDDGRRLYFATAPIPPRPTKDTLTPDDERVKLDVWSWTDARLQPMQQKRLKEEKERGFTTVCDLTGFRVVPLASREVPTVTINYRENPRYWLGQSDVAYQVQSSWDPGHTDLYLIDAQTGAKQKIANDIMASEVALSPGGRYAYWFDERDSLWRAWDVVGGKRLDLTRGLPAKFFDEEHDTPNLPGSYGAAGWTTGDRYVWLYDRYDIWQIDPTGREKPLNLTAGWGRQNRVRLRRADLNRAEGPTEERAIDPTTPLWLTGFWERDKTTGVLRSSGRSASPPTPLAHSAHRYFGLSQAKNAPTLTYYRGNFREPINLYRTDTLFKQPVALTRANPQQDSLRWGSAELVTWLGTGGQRLEGLLYKPDGFSPAQQYPMLVYYYERNNETLHDYRFPAPSRSTINIPYYVSNGYVVFVPDIVYTTGNPGQNAYDCIVPGVLSLIDRGFVDRDRIGIQGQSWGGYQTAYIVTRTNLFRAAMAGAPVANMTSAYGGIRWGTGMSRQFQYEKTQSRIGGTLWDRPMHYLENSPLFYANRVQTPLLLMHNDADGAVPWYQSIELFTALRRLGKPTWLLVYNGEDHNLTQRHNMKDLSIRMTQFFDHYLKAAPQPVWMKEGRSAVEKDRGELKY